MAKVSDWDFFNRNVQSGLLEGRFMNAAFTMVAAGPPRLAAISGLDESGVEVTELGDFAYPIGVLQSLNIGQNSQIMRIWEIGSERSYFIRGRTMGQIGLGRIMYHGPSLLRTLYAYLGANGVDVAFSALYGTGDPALNESQRAKLNTNVSGDQAKNEFKRAPGYENLWMELASDVFSQPIGLLIYMRDSNEITVGAFYLEYCMVTNHGLATDAGGTILTENAAVLYEKVVPVDVNGVALIADSEDISNVISGTAIGSAA